MDNSASRSNLQEIAASSPPANVPQIVQRCGGDPAFAAAVIDRFCNQAGTIVDQIDHALKTKHCDELRRAAHNLKSMSAYVSAESAKNICQEIEKLSSSDQLEAVVALSTTLRAEIDHVVSWLRQQKKSTTQGVSEV